MLAQGNAESWRAKTIEELPASLATAQTSLNEARQFEAAKEVQAFIEIAEAAREVILVTPLASSWVKKGLEDAMGTVLRFGKEKKGQPVLWTSLQKFHIKRFADSEKECNIAKTKAATEPPKAKKAEFPCTNCAKAGKEGIMHTLTECAQAGNACLLECRNCPTEAGTKNAPCHWREFCPMLKKRNRDTAFRSNAGSR